MNDPGRRILEESFAIIERELGPLPVPPWTYAVIRRMIHASGDFDFARSLRYGNDFESAVRTEFHAGAVFVTDTEMVLAGIRAAVSALGATAICLINDLQTNPVEQSTELTRSAAGIRRAASLYPTPIVVIGNAPTALDEALRLVDADAWKPKAIIGMPVGFVGVTEAKERLCRQNTIPYLTCLGRKGGSAVTAAAINALCSPPV
jgi:precorrin-8X/cobalt-precorrin-8 methylmutase